MKRKGSVLLGQIILTKVILSKRILKKYQLPRVASLSSQKVGIK